MAFTVAVIGYLVVAMLGRIKPRLGQDAIWHRETYDAEADTGEYDERLAVAQQAHQQRLELSGIAHR